MKPLRFKYTPTGRRLFVVPAEIETTKQLRALQREVVREDEQRTALLRQGGEP